MKCPGMECPQFKLMDEQLESADREYENLRQVCSDEEDRLRAELERLRTRVAELVEALQAIVPDDFDEHPDDFIECWHKAHAVLAKAANEMEGK